MARLAVAPRSERVPPLIVTVVPTGVAVMAVVLTMPPLAPENWLTAPAATLRGWPPIVRVVRALALLLRARVPGPVFVRPNAPVVAVLMVSTPAGSETKMPLAAARFRVRLLVLPAVSVRADAVAVALALRTRVVP